MLPVLNRPVKDSLVRTLAAQGFTRIMVNTSYRAPQIEDYFRDGSRWGVDIGYSFEGHLVGDLLVDAPVGSAGALRRIHDHGRFFDGTTLVLCADALIDLDLQAFVREHRARGAMASMAVTRVARERLTDYGVVLADADGRVRAFQEKPGPVAAKSDVVNTGIYLFEPEVLDHIPSGAPYDIGSQLFPALIESGAPVFATHLPMDWRDIGTVSDYHATCLAALEGRIPGLRARGRLVQPDVLAGPNVRADWSSVDMRGRVLIGAGASIGAGCTLIGPCVIGHGAVIEAGVSLHRAIVEPYTRIARGTSLTGVIVAPKYTVGADGDARDRRGISDARRQPRIVVAA
jgi:mannose-1-phosphate guanylyltransferase